MKKVTDTMPTKLAVNVTEAAQLISVSRPTMYEILNRADFHGSFRIGSKRLVSVDALREWVEKQTAESA